MDFNSFKDMVIARAKELGIAEYELYYASSASTMVKVFQHQIAFNVIGNDTTITMATEGGQLELNAFEPIIFYKLFESLHTLTEGVNTLRVNCIRGITANKEHCRQLVERSVGIVTTLCPIIGYTEACHLAKEAIETGASVRELVIEKGLIPEDQLDELMDPYKMTLQPK